MPRSGSDNIASRRSSIAAASAGRSAVRRDEILVPLIARLMPIMVLIMRHRLLPLAVTALIVPWILIACNGPRVIQVQPILTTGELVPSADSAILAARQREAALQTA